MTIALINAAKAEAYLTERSIPFTKVTELSGGAANFAYLVEQQEGPGRILKYTCDLVKAFPSMKAPPDRSDAEVRALTVLSPILVPDASLDVHLPTLIWYDAEARTQHQRPAGRRTLKDAYKDPVLDIAAIGTRLGKWVARLHDTKPPAEFQDNMTAKQLYGGCYRHAAGVLERMSLDPEPAKIAREKYGPLLLTEDEYLCHGDFWAGNILLPDPSEANPTLTVVDWEMSRRGYCATDIGQFAAESWLLDRWRGGRGLLPAFLNAYREAAGARVTKWFIQRAMIQCGLHLAYWPSMVEWADTEGTKEILAFGSKLVADADSGNVAAIKASVFAPLASHLAE